MSNAPDNKVFILGVLAEPTTVAFRNGCFVMEKMTVVIVLMNSQSTVPNAMKMETSNARTNAVYQSKLPLFHENNTELFFSMIPTMNPLVEHVLLHKMKYVPQISSNM